MPVDGRVINRPRICNIKTRQNLRADYSKHLFQDEIGVLQSLNVLLDCFYFWIDGIFSTLSRGDIRKACRQVTKVYMSELSHHHYNDIYKA